MNKINKCEKEIKGCCGLLNKFNTTFFLVHIMFNKYLIFHALAKLF